MDSILNEKEILYLSFNQDQSCFAVGLQTGFKIFQTNPFKESFYRNLGGGIGIVEMLYKCNILAIVGGGQKPKFSTNKVAIWDDYQTKIIGELSFRTDIKGVRLKSDKVIVALEHKIYVYNFADLKLIDHIDTIKNPKGLFTLSSDPTVAVLATLGKEIGQVSIHSYDKKKSFSVQAHQSQVGCLELNNKGTRLASVSEKGTLIRVIDAENGTLLHELRRGSEYAQIYSMSFDINSNWLACSGDSSTIHIFSLQKLKNGTNKSKLEIDDIESADIVKNPKSNPSYSLKNASIWQEINHCLRVGIDPYYLVIILISPSQRFAFMKIFSTYFDSEWSFAQYKLAEGRAKLAFGKEKNSIYIMGYDGNFYTITYDAVIGGECIKTFTSNIFYEKN